MKEEKWRLTEQQREWIKKCISKIDNDEFIGYERYTRDGLLAILYDGEYNNRNKGFLNILREDYIKLFCV